MKVVYHFINPFAAEFFCRIAKEAMNRGIDFEFVTESKRAENYLKKHDIEVFNPRSHLKEISNEVNKMDLQAKQNYLRENYNVSVEEVTFSDLMLLKKNMDYRANETLSYIFAWEDYFRRSSPDLVTLDDGSEMPNITFAVVATRHNIPVIYTNGSSIFPDTMYWDKSIMLDTWVKKEHFNKELTSEQRERITNYVKSTKVKKTLIGTPLKGVFSSGRFNQGARFLYNSLIIEKGQLSYQNPTNPVNTALLPAIRKRIAKKFYSTPDFEEKYIFFPLHVPHDSQITLRAPQFVEQYKAVEMCAKNIPQGYTLYVKEHPHAKGFIPLAWIKRMSSLPDVKLVNPDISAHDLIRRSQCVIVINSDVGWETLLYSKPVVTLVKSFYSGLGITFDANCIKYHGVSGVDFDESSVDRLPVLIERALNTTEIEPEKVYRLINAVQSSLYPCSFYTDNYSRFNCDDGNIKRIVDSIEREYRLYK